MGVGVPAPAKSKKKRRAAGLEPKKVLQSKQKSAAVDSGEGVLPGAQYWRRLAPGLHLADESFCASCTVHQLPPARIAALRAQLQSDGFFTLRPDDLPWAPSLKAMRVGVKRLVKRGWPASLLLLYAKT